MYTLTVEDTFASAHQLRGYKGKCENIHGHNWKVFLSVKGKTLDETGLLIDFHDLKKILKDATDYLDHNNINDLKPFDKINPSSENIAEFIYNRVSEGLLNTGKDVAVDSVTVWESANSRCMFSPE